MNPAAPRDPVLTRVLLSIASALFLLNLCVLVAGMQSRASQPMAIVEPQTIAEPTDGHRCVHRHAVVAGVTVDDLRLDLEVLRSRIDRVRWKMEEVPPRVRVMIETPVVSESL